MKVKKVKLYKHAPYTEKIRKATAKNLGLKKQDMLISANEKSRFEREILKFEGNFKDDLLKFLKGEGESPGTFQEYVVKAGETEEQYVVAHDPLVASKNYPQSRVTVTKLEKTMENFDVNEFGPLMFYYGTGFTSACDRALGLLLPYIQEKKTRKEIYNMRAYLRKKENPKITNQSEYQLYINIAKILRKIIETNFT